MNKSLASPSATARVGVSFCPVCWERIAATSSLCPNCGTDIPRYLAATDYGQELIDGLKHSDARRRIAAAWILGERREKRAIPALGRIAVLEKHDTYFAKAAVMALAKIGGFDAAEAIRSAADHHPARLVRQAAKEAFYQSLSKR